MCWHRLQAKWSDDTSMYQEQQRPGVSFLCEQVTCHDTHSIKSRWKKKFIHKQRGLLTDWLPGATTYVGSWPTQEDASIHLCPWPQSSSSWLPTSLHRFCFPYIYILFSGLYNDRTVQVPILKHYQGRLHLVFLFLPRLILWVFVTSVFYRGRSLARRPTPNLEDQSASLSLSHHLQPVRQGRPYQ